MALEAADTGVDYVIFESTGRGVLCAGIDLEPVREDLRAGYPRAGRELGDDPGSRGGDCESALRPGVLLSRQIHPTRSANPRRTGRPNRLFRPEYDPPRINPVHDPFG